MNIFHENSSQSIQPRFYNKEDFENYIKEMRMRDKDIPTIDNFRKVKSDAKPIDNHECDLRNYLGLDCQETLSKEEESHAEVTFFNNEETSSIIKHELGEFPQEEFDKIMEDSRKLDELIDQQSFDLNSKKLGINFIPGNTNNK